MIAYNIYYRFQLKEPVLLKQIVISTLYQSLKFMCRIKKTLCGIIAYF